MTVRVLVALPRSPADEGATAHAGLGGAFTGGGTQDDDVERVWSAPVGVGDGGVEPATRGVRKFNSENVTWVGFPGCVNVNCVRAAFMFWKVTLSTAVSDVTP